MASQRAGLTRGPAKVRALIRRRKFVRSYLAGPEGVRGNATQAALDAGLARTYESAGFMGHTYLKRRDVRREIERYLDRVGATTERILKEIARTGFSDIRDVMAWDAQSVTVKPSRLLDDAAAAAIQEVRQVETKQGRSVHVRLHDKIRALEVLAKIRRVIGEDVPREFTLVISRAGPIPARPGAGQLTGGANDGDGAGNG